MYSGEFSVEASNWFQVSTNVFNDRTDRWEEFEASNSVYTGGPGQKKTYPIDKPETGDIVLVRFGRSEGRGIGVVHLNEYVDGFHKARRLHVVWLNKMPAELSGSTAMIGFAHARKSTPDPKHRLISNDIDGVDCQEMLAAMNERIAALLDREHQIGHTYLLEVAEIGQLSDTFRNRMLPLLQEYFFDDWAKIRVVLGNNAFVTGKKVDIRSADRESMDEDRFVYKRLPDDDPRWEDPGEYRKIYGGESGREPEDA